jgi:hypothetical protein
MSLRSKFTAWIILPVVLLPAIPWMVTLIIERLPFLRGVSLFAALITVALLAKAWLLNVFAELRTKMAVVEIEADAITVQHYFGLAPRRVYHLNELKGFYTSLVPSRFGMYEHLYLIADNKKAVTLSAFYHGNYQALKAALATKVNDLGLQEYSFVADVKELFS